MRLIHRSVFAAALLAVFCFTQSALADDTWRGCLTGTKDNYVLRSVDGNLYRLHSSDDIKTHVGQMVEVKGHVKNKDRDKSALNQTAAAQSAGVTIPTIGIDVEHLKSLSASCPAMLNEKAGLSGEVAPGGVASTTTTTTTTTTVPATGVAAGVSGAVAEGASGGVQAGVAEESGKYQHFTGCVTGTNDNYMLRADDGMLYRLHSDKDIHEHVGDRVDVRGRIDNQKREREARVNGNSEAEAGVQVPKTGINVEDIKTISRGCNLPPQ